MDMMGYAKARGEMLRGISFAYPQHSACSLFSRYPLNPSTTSSHPSVTRQWFHVNTMVIDKASPLFEVLGGMHNVHVNSVGESALRKGGPYPNGTVFLTDLHEFFGGRRLLRRGCPERFGGYGKGLKKYASTGGWGFQFWTGGDPKKPIVTDAAKQCFECHQPKKDQDYVYSTYIP